MGMKVEKVAIANRGEVAVRIIRACREMGLETVLLHSKADESSMAARLAGETYLIGGPAPAESYLNIEANIQAAIAAGADAVHPGFGFLSENAAFARACEKERLVFIGPSPESIELFGDKISAKHLVNKIGGPLIPGYTEDDQSLETLLDAAEQIGYPVIVKATAGGGGRGLKVARSKGNLKAAVESAQREGTSAFGSAKIFLEKYLENAKHIEVQVFGDASGKIHHLFERDCSVQRRHQKIIEEATAPGLEPKMRDRIIATAVKIANSAKYRGAGTVEFLVQGDQYYFMEMNTRLQVEHPVTEAITGLDLVELQLRVAAGEPLPIRQQDVTFAGHAIEVRLCSENPEENFAPQSGRVWLWEPSPGVRVEHALVSGSEVPPHYDSMIAKIIASGRTRDDARRRLIMAVEDFVAFGPRTNQAFLARCLRHPVFAAGSATTDFIDGETDRLLGADAGHAHRVRALGALLLQLTAQPAPAEPRSGILPRLSVTTRFELDGNLVSADVEGSFADLCRVALEGGTSEISVLGVEGHHACMVCDGHRENITFVQADDEVLFLHAGRVHRLRDQRLAPLARASAGKDGRIRASMTGRVVALHAAVGTHLAAGQPVLTIEAMKIEHTQTAPIAGVLTHLHTELNQQVTAHRILAQITPEPPAESPGAGVAGEKL